MKTWIVRFLSLYVFNVVVLLLMGLLPGVRVGWASLWAAVLLTVATLWLKPLFSRIITSIVGKKLVEYAVVLIVAAIIWILIVLFSGVTVSGWFWGWVLPPFALLIAWAIYDAIDDRVEKKAGEVYDAARGQVGSSDAASPAAPAGEAREEQAARRELKDGLTDEQRRMLDEL